MSGAKPRGSGPTGDPAPSSAADGDFVLRSALADLVSGVAHEIRNPVNTISLTSQVVQKLFEKRGRDFEEYREYFRVIHFELGKIKKIIDNFVKFARVPDLTRAPIDVAGLLSRLADQLGPTLLDQGIETSLDLGDPVELLADEELLSEAFLNLLQNSIQSLPDGGTVGVSVRRGDGVAEIRFWDTGPGIGADDPDRIFHPYYTTLPGGLGLGLTLSRSIVESHGGTIRAGTRREGGAEFVIELPLGNVPRGEHG